MNFLLMLSEMLFGKMPAQLVEPIFLTRRSLLVAVPVMPAESTCYFIKNSKQDFVYRVTFLEN